MDIGPRNDESKLFIYLSRKRINSDELTKQDLDFEYQINEEVTKFVYTASSAPNSSSPMIRMDAFHPTSTGRMRSQGSFISCFQGNKEGDSVLLEPDVS